MKTFVFNNSANKSLTFTIRKNFQDNFFIDIKNQDCSVYCSNILERGFITLEAAIKIALIDVLKTEMFLLLDSDKGSNYYKKIKIQERKLKTVLSLKSFLKIKDTEISIY